ncbi:MAG TPA: TrkA family potassium uptake protein [Acidimicrobiales bacterium]|nr:TrkA family potassium uptake protein [Acidimicrobiales bacterium]
MSVIVAGAGRLADDLAVALTRAGNEVMHAAPAPPTGGTDAANGVLTVFGDLLDPATLEAAGALRAEVLVACTPADHDNLAVAALAKRRFEVPRVVALLNDPDHAWLFDATWGVDAAVSASATLLALVAEATGAAGPVSVELLTAGVSVLEATVATGSAAAGTTLADLRLPSGTVIAAVVRRGGTVVPSGSFRLAGGDRVLLVTAGGQPAAFDALFRATDGA